jgi:hypothetical protein
MPLWPTAAAVGPSRRDVVENNARDAMVELAFAPWKLITAGRLEEGLAISMTPGLAEPLESPNNFHR